jgi:hypothetical protein
MFFLADPVVVSPGEHRDRLPVRGDRLLHLRHQGQVRGALLRSLQGKETIRDEGKSTAFKLGE